MTVCYGRNEIRLEKGLLESQDFLVFAFLLTKIKVGRILKYMNSLEVVRPPPKTRTSLVYNDTNHLRFGSRLVQ